MKTGVELGEVGRNAGGKMELRVGIRSRNGSWGQKGQTLQCGISESLGISEVWKAVFNYCEHRALSDNKGDSLGSQSMHVWTLAPPPYG